MSSVIAPMPNSKCRRCGLENFVPKILDKKLKIKVYLCKDCDEIAESIRLRRCVPIGIDGESERVDILHNRMEERIDSLDEALHIARSIDYDLRDGRFDPDNYRPKKMGNAFHFKSMIKNKYIPYCENKFGVGGFETKQVMINHLLRFFGNMDIRSIKNSVIKEYQLIYKCGARSKDLSLQELKVIFDFFVEGGYLKMPPTIPKTSQSRERTAREFITKEEQLKIISYVDDVYYRNMIEVLSIYALRPGDLRAIKWRDLNFSENTLTIRNHFSKSKLKAGRKSTEEELVLPITERFMEIISSLPRSINGDDFLFKAKDTLGRFGVGPVGEARMRIHWNRANAIANRKDKIKIVPLYVGTKSTSLTSYVNEGNRAEDLLSLTGHTSVKTLKRYAKESEENKLKKVRNILSKVSENRSIVL